MFVDVVTISSPCRGKMLRIAPYMSGIKVGDTVMFQVTWSPFEEKGTVEDIATFNTEREEFRLLREFVGANNNYCRFDLDMKVTKKVITKYEDLRGDEEFNERGVD